MIGERQMHYGLLLHSYLRAKGSDVPVEEIAHHAILGLNADLELEGNPTIQDSEMESAQTELASLIIKLSENS